MPELFTINPQAIFPSGALQVNTAPENRTIHRKTAMAIGPLRVREAPTIVDKDEPPGVLSKGSYLLDEEGQRATTVT
jgi:hypothetical protein